MADFKLTIGKIPMRRGVWLGVQEGSLYTPLAKFRSEAAARRFLDLMKAVSGHRVESE